MRAMRRPDSDGAVPATRAEPVLRDEVPVYAEDLAVVFFPVLDGEVVEIGIEEFDTAIAGRCEDLALVDLGPC